MSDTGAVVADLGDGSVLAQFLIAGSPRTRPPIRSHACGSSWEQSDDLVNDIVVEWAAGSAANSPRAPSPRMAGEHPRSTGLRRHRGRTASRHQHHRAARNPGVECGPSIRGIPARCRTGSAAIVTPPRSRRAPSVSGTAWSGVLEGIDESVLTGRKPASSPARDARALRSRAQRGDGIVGERLTPAYSGRKSIRGPVERGGQQWTSYPQGEPMSERDVVSTPRHHPGGLPIRRIRMP
jgi:hypothetical protein